MSAPDVAGDPGAGWDEAQYASSLAQLEQLQAQIDNLRRAIPRIIEPFQRPPSVGMFRQYAQSVQGCQTDITSLHGRWSSAANQAIFEHTRSSLAANTDLSASRSIPAHGWIARESQEHDSRDTSHKESTDEESTTLTDEDVARIIADFQTSNPGIKLEMLDEGRTMTTQFVSNSTKLRFRVSIEREANGKLKLNVTSLGSKEPWLSINRCIASRPQPNDMKSLLDMIVAYKTVKGTSCAKCERLLDDRAMPPIARRSKQIAAPDQSIRKVWEAFHESCLP